jgi:hypothetical protein
MQGKSGHPLSCPYDLRVKSGGLNWRQQGNALIENWLGAPPALVLENGASRQQVLMRTRNSTVRNLTAAATILPTIPKLTKVRLTK